MATSDETNVTIDSIIVVSPSTRNSTGTSRLPIGSHRPTTVIASGPAEKSAPQETRNASTMPATTGTWELDRSRRAPSAAMIAPRSGKHGITQTFCTKKPDIAAPLLSPLQPRLHRVGWLDARGSQDGIRLGPGNRLDRLGLGLLLGWRGRRYAFFSDVLPERHVERGTPVVKDHDERQGNRRLARRHGQNHDCEHLAGQVAVIAPECDQGQRRSLKHHLGRQEHHDQVSPRKEPEHPQGEQGSAHEQVVPQQVERERVNHGLSRSDRDRKKRRIMVAAAPWLIKFSGSRRPPSRPAGSAAWDR